MPDSPLEQLQTRFRARCRDDLAFLRAQAADRSQDGVQALVHRLSGAAGSFGHHELSRLAAVVDDQMARDLQPNETDLARLHKALSAVADGSSGR